MRMGKWSGIALRAIQDFFSINLCCHQACNAVYIFLRLAISLYVEMICAVYCRICCEDKKFWIVISIANTFFQTVGQLQSTIMKKRNGDGEVL